MENLELLLSLAGTVLGLLITSATFLAKFITKAKAKKAADQLVEICNAILPYIEQAEAFAHFTGEEKKEFVMRKVNQYAAEHGIKCDEKYVGDKIDELVGLTKKVNVKGAVKSLIFPAQ